MNAARFPATASVYEAVRTNPEAGPRLHGIGLTRDYYDYRLGDAARAMGIPEEQLTALIAGEPTSGRVTSAP